jgi:hypothetical protein
MKPKSKKVRLYIRETVNFGIQQFNVCLNGHVLHYFPSREMAFTRALEIKAKLIQMGLIKTA